MSSGSQHEFIGKQVMILGLVVGGMARYCGVDTRLVLASLGGMGAGFYLTTPDADFGRLTFSEARWFRDPRRDSLGSLLKAVVWYQVGIAVLVLGFWPGLLLSHRKISHIPVLGSAVIAALALANPFVVALLAATGWWRLLSTGGIVAAWGGFAFAHLVHITMDFLDRG